MPPKTGCVHTCDKPLPVVLGVRIPKGALWTGEKLLAGIVTAIGTLIVYGIAAFIIIRSSWDSLKKAFGLRFSRAEFDPPPPPPTEAEIQSRTYYPETPMR